MAYKCRAGFDLWELAGDYIRNSIPEGGELYRSVPGRLPNLKEMCVGYGRNGQYNFATMHMMGVDFFLGSNEQAQAAIAVRVQTLFNTPQKRKQYEKREFPWTEGERKSTRVKK